MKRQQTSPAAVFKTGGGRDELGSGMRESRGDAKRRGKERSREDVGGTRGHGG